MYYSFLTLAKKNQIFITKSESHWKHECNIVSKILPQAWETQAVLAGLHWLESPRENGNMCLFGFLHNTRDFKTTPTPTNSTNTEQQTSFLVRIFEVHRHEWTCRHTCWVKSSHISSDPGTSHGSPYHTCKRTGHVAQPKSGWKSPAITWRKQVRYVCILWTETRKAPVVTGRHMNFKTEYKGHMSKRLDILLHRYLLSHAHCCSSHNRQEMKTT